VRVIPQKQIPFYLQWVGRFQEFANKKSDEDFPDEELRAFVKNGRSTRLRRP
jgi:hypothetical protein